MNKSKRQEALEALKARLESLSTRLPVDPDNPEANEYPFKFSIVGMGPLGVADHRKAFVAGIVPGRERKEARHPIIDCYLPVNIEFRATVNQQEGEPGLVAEKVITVIQKIISEDRTLGGKCIDITETGNELDLEVYEDKTIVGVVVWNMHYRHSINDPTEAMLRP